MAIARGKFTIFFNAQGGTAPTGWTESWYKTVTDYSELLALAAGYVKVRKELLGDGASITYYRISDDTVKRDTQVVYVQGKDGISQKYTNAEDAYDPVQVDLLLRVEGTPFTRRQWALSGLPDSVTRSLVAGGVEGVFINGAAFKNLTSYIISNGLAIRKEVKPSTDPKTYVLITVDKIQPITVRNRKRGRPFNLFRGRR